ncbi:hypothetical protein MHTCC0001_28610 [Flavobacteriaceae bacterium MHTCC 0001]
MENNTYRINENELDWEHWIHGEIIEHNRKNFTKQFTKNKLVASLYEVPPGKVSWPYHYHTTNEEVFFIIEGEGELRTDKERIIVRTGDFIRFPVGEKGAHQLKNISGDKVLKYLDFGTTNHPDIVFMPDSNKLGLFVGGAPCQNTKNRHIWKYFDLATEIDYLKDE